MQAWSASMTTPTDLVCGMNLDVMDGLFGAVKRAKLEARFDPAPGRCCVRLDDT
jgi:predicted ArsR family transcriptional regulator